MPEGIEPTTSVLRGVHSTVVLQPVPDMGLNITRFPSFLAQPTETKLSSYRPKLVTGLAAAAISTAATSAAVNQN